MIPDFRNNSPNMRGDFVMQVNHFAQCHDVKILDFHIGNNMKHESMENSKFWISKT